MNGAVSVRQLNLYVKSLLDGDIRLARIAVTGEISNFKNHYSSGHWYFTLKDSEAAIRCVMFRSAASRVRGKIQDGIRVTVQGRVSLYERDGQYQFYAEEMTVGSEGELARQFEETKGRLLAEGLFDESRKRALPKFPKRIAVITSETGAAVQDILNVTGRRYPLCEIILCPVAVQGEQAVPEMLNALERVYRISDIDTVIIGRGGGSAEELAAFNDERLARKLYESPFPVISAVGHETDFSISDFVADCRAPTPSAAAELAVPDMAELAGQISYLKRAAAKALDSCYSKNLLRYERAIQSAVLNKPISAICDARAERLDRIFDRLQGLCQKCYEGNAARLSREAARLEALSPLKVMLRGFAAVKNINGTVRSAGELTAGERISLRFSDGIANCTVEEIRNNG